jgi:hypothetical protein
MKNNLILIYIYYFFISYNKKDKLNFLINKKTYNYYLKKNNIFFFKYNYIFIYLIINSFTLNLFNLLKSNKYFNKLNKNKIGDFFLRYKDNKLLIYLETYNKNLLINKFKFNFFSKEKKLKIFIYRNFVFKIEIIIYLIYRDYIDWIKRYKYNEYLDENLFKYPMLKVLLRKIDQYILNLIKKKEKNFINRLDIINNYNLYFIDKKRNIYYLDFVNQKYWYFFNKKMKIIKLLFLLLKLNLFYKNNNNNFNELKNNIFLFYFWFRKIKHFEITTAYNYYLIGYDWSRSEKLKSETINDFYWQMNRYGFLLYYYYPLTFNYVFYILIRDKILNIFNILFFIKYRKKQKIKSKIINLCWYKLIKLISIDYIKKYLFIFFFFIKWKLFINFIVIIDLKLLKDLI